MVSSKHPIFPLHLIITMGVYGNNNCRSLSSSQLLLPPSTVAGQVSLTATVTCNQYYLLSCGADGAR